MQAKKKYIIVVAGGMGKRMLSAQPKQFISLNGMPLLYYTLQRIHEAVPDAELILTLPATEISAWKNLCTALDITIPHVIVEGGRERFFSVQNALRLVTENNSVTGVHDGVRPFVSTEVIQQVFEKAEKEGAAIPLVPLSESLRKIVDGQSFAVNRSEYYGVQTPQCFQTMLLKEAYTQTYTEAFTDDASVVEAAGNSIAWVPGNAENIKITTPADMLYAAALLEKK